MIQLCVCWIGLFYLFLYGLLINSWSLNMIYDQLVFFLSGRQIDFN